MLEILEMISEIFDSAKSKLKLYEGLDRLKAELGPASEMPGATACNRSGYCCWRSPPTLSRADLAKAAKAVDKSEKEFFMSHCVVDYDGPVDNRILRVKFRREHQGDWGGRMLSTAETNTLESPCVFLIRKTAERPAACFVHGVKPAECASFKCWDNAKIDAMSREAYEASMPAWAEADLRELGWDGQWS